MLRLPKRVQRDAASRGAGRHHVAETRLATFLNQPLSNFGQVWGTAFQTLDKEGGSVAVPSSSSSSKAKAKPSSSELEVIVPETPSTSCAVDETNERLRQERQRLDHRSGPPAVGTAAAAKVVRSSSSPLRFSPPIPPPGFSPPPSPPEESPRESDNDDAVLSFHGPARAKWPTISESIGAALRSAGARLPHLLLPSCEPGE